MSGGRGHTSVCTRAGPKGSFRSRVLEPPRAPRMGQFGGARYLFEIWTCAYNCIVRDVGRKEEAEGGGVAFVVYDNGRTTL